MNLGLRSRYALTIMAMVAALVALLAAALLHQFHHCVVELMQTSADTMSRELVGQMEKRGEAIARFLATNTANPLYLSDMAAMREILTTALEDEDIISACVYDKDGRVVHDGTDRLLRYGTPVNPGASLPPLGPKGVAEKHVTGEVLTVSMPVWVGEAPIGGVRICLSMDSVSRQIEGMCGRLEGITLTSLRRNLLTLGFTSAALLALGGAVSVLVARTLARPIRQLDRWAEALGRGDYSAALPPEREDEVGGLIRTFDRMRTSLQQTTVSRDHLGRILGSMTDALALVKPDGTIEMVNAALRQLLGYGDDELHGRPFVSLFEPSARDEVAADLQRLREAGGSLSLDTTYLRKDGTEVTVAFSASTMPADDGEGGGIISVAQDITTRKAAESALRFRADFEQVICAVSKSFINLPSTEIGSEIGRALAAVGEFVKAGRGYVFSFSDDGRDLKYTHEWCAPGVEPRFGGRQEFAMADFPWWMERLSRHEDIRIDRVADLPAEEQETREALERQGVRSLLLLPMAIGERTFGLMGFDAVQEERRWSADTVALLAIVRDTIVSALERERTEAAQHALETQIQQAQKLESLGLLAGGIAHDFNNILAAILGNAELAMLEMPEDARARGSMDEIRTASLRAAELVSQMLAYAGKTAFFLDSVDLNQLVVDMGRLLRVTLSKKAEVRYRLADQLPAIRADAGQIRQVVMNLITNASEAIGDETGVISVSTGIVSALPKDLHEAFRADTLPEREEYLFLEVADTGCGFAAEVGGRLFDPFFSTKFTGRGLGLAATLGIVRGHRGAMLVRSEPGCGATFRVLFPHSGARPLEASSPDEAEGPDAWSGSGTILLADDEPSLRRSVPLILQALGFDVLLAEDGGEAVNLFREHSGHLAATILDLTMPVMNGVEAFRRIRQLDPHAVVILASGRPPDQIPGGLEGTGLAGFLQKPYRMHELRSKLREILGGEAQPELKSC